MPRSRGSRGIWGLFGRIIKAMVPKTDDSVTIGTASKRWAQLFAVAVLASTLTLGTGVLLSAEGDRLLVNTTLHVNGSLIVEAQPKGNVTLNVSDFLVVLDNSLLTVGTTNMTAGLEVTELAGAYTGGNATVCVFDNGTLFIDDTDCS